MNAKTCSGVLLLTATLALAALAARREKRRGGRCLCDVLDTGLDRSTLADPHGAIDVTEDIAHRERRQRGARDRGRDVCRSIIDRRRAAATFLPTLSLAPSYTWTDDPGSTNRDSKGINTPLELGMAVNPVRDVAVLRSSSATIEERRALLLDFQDTLLLDVTQTRSTSSSPSARWWCWRTRFASRRSEWTNDAKVRLDAGLIGRFVRCPKRKPRKRRPGSFRRGPVFSPGVACLGFLTAAPMADRPLNDSLSVPSQAQDLDALLAEAEAGRISKPRRDAWTRRVSTCSRLTALFLRSH